MPLHVTLTLCMSKYLQSKNVSRQLIKFLVTYDNVKRTVAVSLAAIYTLISAADRSALYSEIVALRHYCVNSMSVTHGNR